MPNTGFFNLYPQVPLCLSIIGGIVFAPISGLYLDVRWWAMAFIIMFSVAILCDKKPLAQSVSILFLAFMLGGLIMALKERSLNVSFPPGESTIECVIAEEPVYRERIIRCDAFVTSGPLCGHSIRISLLKETVRHDTLRVGDGLLFRSSLEPPTNFIESNFDYVTYLKGRGIVATTFLSRGTWTKVIANINNLSLFQRAKITSLKYRYDLLSQYRGLGLDGQDFAVVAAMTLGDKSSLTNNMRDVYSISGASHILALSGMHLGIIYAILSLLTFGFRYKLLREIILLVCIWLYVFIVGFSPSVLRSASMITIYAMVSVTGRSRSSINALSFAAIVLLIVNPLMLYDVGFQLSFVAVAFILVFQSSIGGIISYKYQQQHRFIGWVWQIFVISLLAQVGTMPLVAFYFERLPLYSLLTSFIVIPAATIILYSAIAIFTLVYIPVLQHGVAVILAYVVNKLNVVLSYVSSWPYASINIHFNVIQVILLYVFVVCLLSLVAIYFQRQYNVRDFC